VTDAYGRPLVAAVAVPPAESISEAELQQRVTDLADETGWHWHHQAISKRSKPGWLDLTLWREAQTGRPGRLLFRELKDEDGRLTAGQLGTIDTLRAAGQDAGVWRPSSWSEIVATLTAT